MKQAPRKRDRTPADGPARNRAEVAFELALAQDRVGISVVAYYMAARELCCLRSGRIKHEARQRFRSFVQDRNLTLPPKPVRPEC